MAVAFDIVRYFEANKVPFSTNDPALAMVALKAEVDKRLFRNVKSLSVFSLVPSKNVTPWVFANEFALVPPLAICRVSVISAEFKLTWDLVARALNPKVFLMSEKLASSSIATPQVDIDPVTNALNPFV